MTVVATSYQAIAASLAIVQLAGGATFQALTGTGSVAAAKGRIVTSSGGTPFEAGAEGGARACDGTAIPAGTLPLAIVHPPRLRSERAGVGQRDYSGEIQVELLLPGRQPAETINDAWDRARNSADGIRAEIDARFGAAGCLADGDVDLDGPTLATETDPDGAFAALITISWEG